MSALIYSPFPDREAARSVAASLLDEKLIACANILGETESLFEWEGERGRAQEVGVLFKTHADILNRAVSRLTDLHPYEVPAVLGWNCEVVDGKTASWLSGLLPDAS